MCTNHEQRRNFFKIFFIVLARFHQFFALYVGNKFDFFAFFQLWQSEAPELSFQSEPRVSCSHIIQLRLLQSAHW